LFAGATALASRPAVKRTSPLAWMACDAIEWGGALRWFAGEQAAARGAAVRLGGHAVLYRGESLRCREGVPPLVPALLATCISA
jgi:glycolate oxidase FAD binding subunit